MVSGVAAISLQDVGEAGAWREALLALNNAHAMELSWLEPGRLQHLVAEALVAWRIGEVDAFLLAFNQHADYDSPNFMWFCSRSANFVYVDRVVVAPSARACGHARRLYQELFKRSAAAGYERIVCEVNVDPPNSASDAFHAALGFVEVGRGTVQNDSKTVRYLVRDLDRRLEDTSNG